jgi:mutator protein MutT
MMRPEQFRTLLLLVKDGQVLLAMKKRGFGAGHWNGVGGKLEPGETIEQATIRECQEEICVTPKQIDKVAIHGFILESETMQAHTYLCTEWEGKPTETEEMAPQWFNFGDIPFDTMWQDDIYWLPAVLAGRKLHTTFVFDKNDKLLSASIKQVDSL